MSIFTVPSREIHFSLRTSEWFKNKSLSKGNLMEKCGGQVLKIQTHKCAQRHLQNSNLFDLFCWRVMLFVYEYWLHLANGSIDSLHI